MFTQALRTIALLPGKPLVYQWVYNPVAMKKVLDSGRYELVGIWPTINKTYRSEPVCIEIRN